MKEHVRRTAMMKSTIITEKHVGVINEMEKLLMMCMEAQVTETFSVEFNDNTSKGKKFV
jgi:hypothetical protein